MTLQRSGWSARRLTKSVAHPSDSLAQRAAEAALLQQLSASLGFKVSGDRVDLRDGCFSNVDGINRDNRFICEVYSRIGKLQAAQVEKVASDVLKLTVLERALGGRWRKAICFADGVAANVLRNRSWLALAARQAEVEVIVVPLPEAVREAVLAAQTRQVMTNKVVDG